MILIKNKAFTRLTKKTSIIDTLKMSFEVILIIFGKMSRVKLKGFLIPRVTELLI